MPMATANFSACGASEIFWRSFDFGPGLSAGETLTGTPTVTITVISGTDSTPQSRLIQAPSLAGTLVQVLLGTMVNGATYQILAQVSTSKGQNLSCWALQPCSSP